MAELDQSPTDGNLFDENSGIEPGDRDVLDQLEDFLGTLPSETGKDAQAQVRDVLQGIVDKKAYKHQVNLLIEQLIDDWKRKIDADIPLIYDRAAYKDALSLLSVLSATERESGLTTAAGYLRVKELLERVVASNQLGVPRTTEDLETESNPKQKACTHCGILNDLDNTFCIDCGRAF